MVRVSPHRWDGLAFAATPDRLDIGEAEVLARALARFDPSDEAAKIVADRAADARAGQDFLDLFGIADARVWDPHQLWARVTPEERLRIPLGKTPQGKVEWLDIKEGAEGGDGPHGHMVGQTGSGKSEHLTAIVLTTCMLFPPEMVQFLLGDFKGEASFGVLEHLPHVQGVVSNLTSSQHKLDRLEDVINGEVMRREEILKHSGYKNVRDYEAARASTKKDLEPLGALIILFDELAELLAKRPEIAKTLERVALKGRALWMHLLLASQRVEGKVGGLLPQCTYAIGMKVKDAAQSRAAIGSPRAYEDLKRTPQGSAFLVVEDEHKRYRSFYVSAPFVPPKPSSATRAHTEGQFVDVHRFGARVSALPADIEDDNPSPADAEMAPATPGVDAPTVLSVLCDRLAHTGSRGQRHRLWLPPLEDTERICLDELVGEFWGRDWREVRADCGLVVPFARADDPFAHSQDVVSVDFSAAGGNVAIAGATQSGKSTAVQTLLMMLAVSHSPQRVQFYGIDLGGGQLANVAGLPHVSGIAGRGDEEKMRRVVSEVERVLRFRERSWAAAGLNITEFRARKFGGRTGVVPDDGHGDVFLVIDNIGVLQRDFLDLHDRMVSLAESQALNYGIHLIVTNDQWYTMKMQLLNKCRQIELRMGKPNESEMRNRDAAARVPDQPGRGLLSGGTHMLVGVPGAEGAQFADGALGAAPTAAAVARCWQAAGVPPAPPLPLLPAEIAYAELGLVPAGTLKLGIGEHDLSTVGVDLNASPHFYAAGSPRSGRTTVLRTLLASIMATYTPEQAEVILFDPNYELADWVDPAYRKVYASSVSEVSQLSAAIAQKLEQRRPPPGTPPEELAGWRHRGPRWFVVVDDLNLLNPPGTTASALLPLAAGISAGKQLGLHVLAATSVQNWYATGLMNKVITAMNTQGAGVLVMDGPKQEKVIDEIRAAPRVPGRGELVYRKAGSQLVQVALPPTPHRSNSWGERVG